MATGLLTQNSVARDPPSSQARLPADLHPPSTATLEQTNLFWFVRPVQQTGHGLHPPGL